MKKVLTSNVYRGKLDTTKQTNQLAKRNAQMTTLTAKYTTLKTLNSHSFSRMGFDDYMSEYGYVTRDNKAQDCIEIVDPETDEVMDYAHPIVISHNGERYYDVYLSEMNSFWELDGEWFDTVNDDVEFSNYPTAVRKAIRK